jgi:hypothetical protein
MSHDEARALLLLRPKTESLEPLLEEAAKLRGRLVSRFRARSGNR